MSKMTFVLDDGTTIEYEVILIFKSGITDKQYILYTDDALGDLLEKIVVIDNSIIQFTDPLLYSVFINC